MDMKNNRYIFKMKAINLKLNSKLIKKYPIIILKDIKNDVYVVHKISQFIFDTYLNLKYNSQRMAVEKIVVFLNYILDNDVKLYEVTFQKAEEFLNSLYLKGLSKDTIKKYELVLTKFFYWLSKNKIININLSKFTFENINVCDKDIKYIASPFKKVIYGNKSYNDRIHTIRLDLVPMFLETAIIETNRIALGVYFQLFGGLRKGDIVNLTKKSVGLKGLNGEYGIELNIKKRNLRNDINDSAGSSEVKKPRKQIVISIGNDVLPTLYKNHINRYTNNRTQALFTNYNGEAMTGDSYEYYFKKLKRAFIRRLLESNDIRLNGYGKVLSTQKWNTHIGRGIFSNMIAQNCNELQLSVMRGDSSTKSSHVYIESSEQNIKVVNNALNKMYFKFTGGDE